VLGARALQHSRAGKTNALLGQSEIMASCRLSAQDQSLLERAVDALQLSARSIHRILRVARTIADLDDRPHILTAHLTEALAYRRADRGADARAA
jgi:magnesium chelatase family protein